MEAWPSTEKNMFAGLDAAGRPIYDVDSEGLIGLGQPSRATRPRGGGSSRWVTERARRGAEGYSVITALLTAPDAAALCGVEAPIEIMYDGARSNALRADEVLYGRVPHLARLVRHIPLPDLLARARGIVLVRRERWNCLWELVVDAGVVVEATRVARAPDGSLAVSGETWTPCDRLHEGAVDDELAEMLGLKVAWCGHEEPEECPDCVGRYE